MLDFFGTWQVLFNFNQNNIKKQSDYIWYKTRSGLCSQQLIIVWHQMASDYNSDTCMDAFFRLGEIIFHFIITSQHTVDTCMYNIKHSIPRYIYFTACSILCTSYYSWYFWTIIKKGLTIQYIHLRIRVEVWPSSTLSLLLLKVSSSHSWWPRLCWSTSLRPLLIDKCLSLRGVLQIMLKSNCFKFHFNKLAQ